MITESSDLLFLDLSFEKKDLKCFKPLAAKKAKYGFKCLNELSVNRLEIQSAAVSVIKKLDPNCLISLAITNGTSSLTIYTDDYDAATRFASIFCVDP